MAMQIRAGRKMLHRIANISSPAGILMLLAVAGVCHQFQMIADNDPKQEEKKKLL